MNPQDNQNPKPDETSGFSSETPSPAFTPSDEAAEEQSSPQGPEGPGYGWQASEYIFHEKPLSWYLMLLLLVAVICAALAFFQQWLSIAVVIVMALAVFVFSRKQPRTLHYELDDDGINIDGKHTPYAGFRSYSILQEVGWHEIDLEPTKRFVPRLTLLCGNDDLPKIESILSAHLPRADREHDWIERTTRYLRF